ncbi:glycosyltransferase family 39 protein [soil metagenome]
MPKKLLYLILFSTLLRIIVAALLELSNDEVYYFLYALDLQPNYFDHPPAVGVLIRIFTGNLLFTSEIFVRLGAIVSAAAGTYLSYQLGSLIKNERTGWFAAILYNTSIYTSVIAGTFIIPDSPQVVFWMASLLVMYQIILKSEQKRPVELKLWLGMGLLSGLCIMCKVHGVFLWFGFGLYVIFYQRRLFADYGIYLAAFITTLVICPILLWNIQNDFITYKFHSERVAIQESLFHFDYFFQTLGGQLLYNNPINAVLIIISLWKLRSMQYLSPTAQRFILLSGLPMILIVTGMSLFNSLLPHWSGPGFMVLGLLAAAYLDERYPAVKNIPLMMRASAWLITTAFIAASLLIKFYPGTLGYHDRPRYGEGDFTLDMSGWANFGKDFNLWLADQKKNSSLKNDIKIVSHKWFPAAHLDYYVSIPYNNTLVGVGKVTDLHQYFWLNRMRPRLNDGEDALFIVPSNYSVNLEHVILPYFTSSELRKTFESKRSGSTARYFDVYLVKEYKGEDEVRAGVSGILIP